MLYQYNKCAFCLHALQLNELVVGDTNGKLFVYKNDDSKPWITRTCVGMVSTETRERLWFNKVYFFLS